jgi:hypothetical protein
LHVRLPSVSPRSYQLEAAVHSLIRAHAQRAGIDRSEADRFFQTLRTNALRAALQQAGEGGADEILRPDQLMYIAVRLWTSTATLRGREFCSLLNQALREDGADTIGHAATIAHAINTFCVARRGDIPIPWPSEHVLYRGGALPRCFQSFFAVGKAYRAPMFVATSADQHVSVHTFLMRLPPAAASQSPPFQEPVLWRFHLDGALPPNRRCVQVNFIDRTDGTVHDENEFLFAPYSTFTVRALEWSPQPSVNALIMKPHYIDVNVASDNLEQPLDLPLAPWC